MALIALWPAGTHPSTTCLQPMHAFTVAALQVSSDSRLALAPTRRLPSSTPAISPVLHYGLEGDPICMQSSPSFLPFLSSFLQSGKQPQSAPDPAAHASAQGCGAGAAPLCAQEDQGGGGERAARQRGAGAALCAVRLASLVVPPSCSAGMPRSCSRAGRPQDGRSVSAGRKCWDQCACMAFAWRLQPGCRGGWAACV